MIVAVCADKPAPGATVLATAMGMVWPGERLVLESDVSGGDLAYWLHPAGGASLLAPTPNTLTVAAEVRSAASAVGLSSFAQLTSVGVPVIPGALRPEAFAPMATLWPQLSVAAARWPGTVIADLGRLQPGNPAAVMAKAATAVVVVVRPTVEGLHRLRDRVSELTASVGTAALTRTPVTVVVVAPARERKAAVKSVEQMLRAAGSPVAVAGAMALDPKGLALLRAGVAGKALWRSELMTSSKTIVERLLDWWPELVETRPVTPPNLDPSEALT